MESLPQNPEFRNNPENFHPWTMYENNQQTELLVHSGFIQTSLCKIQILFKDF